MFHPSAAGANGRLRIVFDIAPLAPILASMDLRFEGRLRVVLDAVSQDMESFTSKSFTSKYFAYTGRDGSLEKLTR